MLRDALSQSLRGNAALPFAAPTDVLGPLAKLLIERHGDSGEPRRSARELAALVQRLRLARFDWSKIANADRLDIAWVLWDRPEPPAEHDEFLDAYLAWIDQPWRRIQACRIAAAWAAAFDPRLASIRRVGEWLAARAEKLLSPWPELDHSFEIFSWARAPGCLAAAFLASDASDAQFCERWKLSGRIAAGGLMLEALGEAASEVEAQLARQPDLAERLAAFAIHDNGFRPQLAAARTGRARAIAFKLAEALLLPWQDASPPEALKRQILGFLLEHYDDARVKTALWEKMRPEAQAVMRLWLTEATIEHFFKLAAAAGREEPQQLRLRRQFWMSYLDRIEDALLVGGSQAVAAPGIGKLGHGTLIGAKPDHAALILKIGGLTIVELSHSSRELLWLPGNELAPRIRHRANEYYLPAALSTGADFSSAFSSDDDDDWQGRLGAFIARHASPAPAPRAKVA
ncbi:MAG TPA: EH signature domain-containing protein [Stellaceae bacterium]|nr:EH signature domain-containing protein [Stellaceae bacterium]